MADQTFNISFKGYYRESKKEKIPNKSGIYCVYRCIYNKEDKNISIKELIYIGESSDVQARIKDHEHQEDWDAYLENGEELCYSFGEITSQYRERCEAAMIFQHEPPVNIEYIDNFPFDKTTLDLTGETAKLIQTFSVKKTEG